MLVRFLLGAFLAMWPICYNYLSHGVMSGNNITPPVDYIFSYLPYEVVSGSEITPCNKIDKPLVGY